MTTITDVTGNEVQVSEHYINQLKDSVNWLEYARNTEDNLDKKAQLEKELTEARDQLSRLTVING